MMMTLWKFKLTVKSRTEAIRRDGTVSKDGKPITFLGSALDANKMAATLQHELAPRYPDEDVTVRPKAAERVGPYTLAQLGKLGGEREEAMAIAQYLAWLLAQEAAKKSLELNPDLKDLAEVIIEMARAKVTADMQAKVTLGLIVDGNGRPARA